MLTLDEMQRKVYTAKRKVLDMCVSAGKGHLTSAYSCAEILSVLYYEVLRINPRMPQWSQRDRFIMSKNHGSVMLYPILADLGFFDASELDTFMEDGTRLGGHSKLCLPGIDFAGGSLGIGFGVSVGLAYAAKMENQDWRTFCIIGDAESYEGAVWEAAMLAGHLELDNLIVFLDRNRLGITGFTEDILRLEPIADKWRAFRWEVRVIDGHSIEETRAVLSDVRQRKGKGPLIIIANTTKGHGISFMSDEPLCHGAAPRSDQVARAYTELEVALQ